MFNLLGSEKIIVRSGFCAILIMISSLGCVASPASPSIHSTVDVMPASPTDTILIEEPEDLIEPAFTSPAPLEGNSIPQPIPTISSQLNNPIPETLSAKNYSTDVGWEMLSQINRERVVDDLKHLTGELPVCINNECFTIKNRLTGSEGLQWAKDYLYQDLVSMGYSVELQDWSWDSWADQNVIATKRGTISPDEKIFFVAHLDGTKKDEKQDKYPGADDNASGVVDLLEVARILASYPLNRTVVFFFSTGEERGLGGVKSFLSQASQSELSSIKYVINVDMVAYDLNQDGLMELWSGDHAPSLALAQTMSDIITAYKLNLVPTQVVGCG